MMRATAQVTITTAAVLSEGQASPHVRLGKIPSAPRAPQLWSLLCLLFAFTQAAAQQRIEVGDVERCATCRIVLAPIAVLGEEQDPDSPASLFVIARSGSGKILVAPMSNLATLGVYSENGRLEQIIGRKGEGPGEFTYLQDVKLLPGDTLILVDLAQNRYSVFSPDFNYLKSFRLPFSPRAVIPLSTEEIIAHGAMQSAERVGFTLHRLVRGVVVSSFGEMTSYDTGGRYSFFRHVAPSADRTSIWSARVNRYTIERWSTDGMLEKVYIGKRGWFPNWESMPNRTEEPPPPSLVAIWERDGYLFVMFNLANDNWSPEVARSRPSENIAIARARYTSTRIEVLDPETGDLVTSYQTETMLNGPLMGSPGLVESRVQTSSGHIEVRIWDVQFTRPSSGGGKDAVKGDIRAGPDGRHRKR